MISFVEVLFVKLGWEPSKMYRGGLFGIVNDFVEHAAEASGFFLWIRMFFMR